MEGRAGTGGRNKKRLRLDAWAFARISLKLTDDEYASYTQGEVSALRRAWQNERDYEYALHTASALVGKWSSSENPIPCEPKQLLPMSYEDRKKHLDAQEKQRIAQQHFLAAELRSYANSLPPIKK